MHQTKMRYARAIWMVERRLRGDTVNQIATDLQISTDTVGRELKRAAQRGYIEVVRDKLLKTLEAAPDVYAAILDPAKPAGELHKESRGWKLKLDAANSLADGLGAFRRETTKNVQNTLEVVAGEQEPKDVGFGSTTQDRVRFQPDVDSVPVKVEDVTERVGDSTL